MGRLAFESKMENKGTNGQKVRAREIFKFTSCVDSMPVMSSMSTLSSSIWTPVWPPKVYLAAFSGMEQRKPLGWFFGLNATRLKYIGSNTHQALALETGTTGKCFQWECHRRRGGVCTGLWTRPGMIRWALWQWNRDRQVHRRRERIWVLGRHRLILDPQLPQIAPVPFPSGILWGLGMEIVNTKQKISKEHQRRLWKKIFIFIHKKKPHPPNSLCGTLSLSRLRISSVRGLDGA